MGIPEVLKDALPFLEEVITGLTMLKGEVVLEEDELKDVVDMPIEEGVLVEVQVENGSGKMACFLEKKTAALVGGKILGMEAEDLTDELRDAFMEFMNQFWGRLRLELTKFDESFNFTQPEMVDANKEDVLLKGYSSFFPLTLKMEEDEIKLCMLLDEDMVNLLQQMAEKPETAEDAEIVPKEEQDKGMVKVSGEKLDLILDIELPVVVSLGKSRMKIKDVLKLGPGSLIELDRSADDYVDLVVNGKVIARGEVVVVESNFALRIKEIVSRAERIKGLRK